MTVRERLDAMVDMAVMEKKMRETEENGTVTEGVCPVVTCYVWKGIEKIPGIQIFSPNIYNVAKEVGAEVIDSDYGLYFMYKNIAFFSYRGAV